MGQRLVLETTVHPKPVPAEQIYGGKLSITYDPIAWFNEHEYRED